MILLCFIKIQEVIRHVIILGGLVLNQIVPMFLSNIKYGMKQSLQGYYQTVWNSHVMAFVRESYKKYRIREYFSPGCWYLHPRAYVQEYKSIDYV